MCSSDLKTGSRNRLRVPVAGTRFNSIKPGDKVSVASFQGQALIEKIHSNSRKSNIYTVEPNGAIRIPAHKFGLPSKNAKISCDSLTKMVLLSN